MNLLPDSRKKALARLYLLRAVVVAALVVSGVLLIHVGLMTPSYLYFHQIVRDRSAELAGLGQELAGTEEQQVSTRVKSLNDNATYLSQAAARISVSKAVRTVTEVNHPGVRITGISFTVGANNKPSTMIVTGVAASRDVLRAYASALKTLPYITSADLPISAYAKETDIDFVVTLTGSFNI